MNRGCNIHIADVVSAIMPEIVLFFPHKLKLNAVKLLSIAKYLKIESTYRTAVAFVYPE
jgi:hypothetical protein